MLKSVTPAIQLRNNMEQEYTYEPYPPRNAGGQHVGKLEVGMKVTHLPSGLVAICNTERSQLKNRDIAIAMIKAGLKKNKLESPRC